MEKVTGEESETVDVYEMIGEPAIVINGVPNLTPGCMAPIHTDPISYREADRDPSFVEWFEGRKVERMFEGRLYSGKVVKYDSQTKWYRVVYENDDLEDLEWRELEQALLPLDISVPLVTLASQKCRESLSKYGPHSKTNKSYSKDVESFEKTSRLLQAPHSVRSKDQKLVEENYSSQRASQIQTRSRISSLESGVFELSYPYSGDNITK